MEGTTQNNFISNTNNLEVGIPRVVPSDLHVCRCLDVDNFARLFDEEAMSDFEPDIGRYRGTASIAIIVSDNRKAQEGKIC